MSKTAKPTQSSKPAGKPKSERGAGPQTPPATDDVSPSAAPSCSPAETSKTARVIALLQRQDGASLDELVAETGWQRHTTRAALTSLRKKGYVIASERINDVRRYRAAAPK
jgi:biotin operon repressor